MNSSGQSSVEAKNRFNFAFKSWIRIVTEFFSPLTLSLDDLQWADASSLSLLELLMGDRDSAHFLFIGIYRSNEVDDAHLLTKTKRNLALLAESHKDEEKYFDVCDIHVNNLHLENVHGIIQSLLSMDSESDRTLGLAKLCLKKTDGNPLFLLQYMALLHRMQLLSFSLGALTWQWDELEITKQTEATENVVDLLQSKMSLLDVKQREILPLMACLGTTFSERHLALVLGRLRSLAKVHNSGDDEQLLRDALSSFESEGYIQCVVESYRWVHDRVREAASSLIPEDERPSFNRQVGEFLLSGLDNEERKSSVFFVIVELLNQSPKPESTSRCVEQAQLNLDATKRSISSSAFDSAAKYAAKGIELLPDEKWRDYYNLSLELFSLGAQAEGYLGNLCTMDLYYKEVLSQKERPLEDKFPVYNIWVDSMANVGHVRKAADVVFGILQHYNCSFPKQGSFGVKSSCMWNILKIKSNMNAKWFDNLEPLADFTRAELMRFLDKLITYLYLLDDDRMPLVVFRMLKWTLKFGYCEYSAVAIVFVGVIFGGILNDLQKASICRELTLFLMAKMEFRLAKSRIHLIVPEFLDHWHSHINECIKPLFRAYEIGLESGDTESASWAIYHSCFFKFFTGIELDTLEVDLRAYCRQMVELERQTPLHFMAMLWQVTLNFLGQADDFLVLDGEAVDAKKYSLLMMEPEYRFVLSVYKLKLAVLYCYMGAHEQLANLTHEVGYDCVGNVFPGTLPQVVDVYLKGVSCFAAARETKNRNYASLGGKCLSRLKFWSKNGNPNVQHYLALVKAEQAAFQGKTEKAVGFYLTALRQAARGGFAQDAGLANERLAEFYLNVVDDLEEARFRVKEAIKYFRDWGAVCKVDMLMAKYSDLMTQGSSAPIEIIIERRRFSSQLNSFMTS